MQNTRRILGSEGVIELLNQGCTIWYLYLDGGVALHTKNRSPMQDVFIDIGTFLKLRADGIIEVIESRGTGYPFYANNTKIQIYGKKGG